MFEARTGSKARLCEAREVRTWLLTLTSCATLVAWGVACGEPSALTRTPAHKPAPPVPAAPPSTRAEVETPVPVLMPEVKPAALSAVAIHELELEGLVPLVERAIARGELPGCVIGIGDRAGLRFLDAYGERTQGEPMTVDTIFDLASLTKPIATAASVMALVDEHKLGLDQAAHTFLPELVGSDKRRMTLTMLLEHSSGLPSVNGLSDYEQGAAHALAQIGRQSLLTLPGAEFRYSDLGFILLGATVERVSKQSLATYAERALFAPLRMTDTHFKPDTKQLARIAPTEERDDQPIRGVVDDPRAYRLGGVAGHAGLFSTAHDLSRFARMLLGQGELDGVRVLSPAAASAMTEPRALGRTLGFDVNTGYSDARGKLFSPRAFGHGGYTGTSLWIDPERDLFVVLLSNRVHAGPKGTIHPLTSSVGDLAVSAIEREKRGTAPLQTGIDVLAEEAFARVRGRRIALLTHAAAQDRQGQSSLERLTQAPAVVVRQILSPEHGLLSDREGHVASSVYRAKPASIEGSTQPSEVEIPVQSLFGKQRKPRSEALRDVDLVVIDLVDVGARFYTYMATALLTLEAAAEANIPVMVLDRPNPIDGIHVEGPISEPAFASFVNYHPLPLRHGMTAGELLSLLARERGLDVRLEVVRMRGYRRDMSFTDTGLTWRAPSPNLQRPEQALLYPAVALLEGTNVSVGRGTAQAFEVIGAPFIDANRLSEALNARGLGFVHFSATRFTPRVGPYAGKRVPGVKVSVTDRAAYLAAPLGLALAQSLAALFPESWDHARLEKMLAHAQTVQGVLAQTPTSQLMEGWLGELETFSRSRKSALLY